MKVMRRVQKLFEVACNHERPEIPTDFGQSKIVLEAEATLIKKMYADGFVEELIELELGMKPEHIDLVLEGQVWPYSGGALKRVMTGPHPSNCYSLNQKRFIRGVNAIAVGYLTKDELQVYCDMTGTSVPKLIASYKKVEVRDGREKFKRLRGLLLYAAQGKDIDRAPSDIGDDGT